MLVRLLSQLFGGRKGNAERGSASPAPPERAAESPEYGIKRGRALEQAGDLAAALECYRDCAAAHPQTVNAHLAAAAVLAALWRNEECVEALRRAHEAA